MQPIVEYPPETWLFAGPDHPEVIEAAKSYIKTEGYTIDTVKLGKVGVQIVVVVR